MIDVEMNGNAPEHIDRLKPHIGVSASGRITWVPGFVDHNANLYARGKQITSEEFNEALLKNIFQGNYLADTLNEFFNEHLGTAIFNTFKSAYNLVPSYTKTFDSTDWGVRQDDGYYYITIPASEHGIAVDPEKPPTDRMNINVEMYLLDAGNNFYQISQVIIDDENTVTIYTDNNTAAGFIVIRDNDKSYTSPEERIDIAQIIGLPEVARTGEYTDLVGLTNPEGTGPDDRINRNTKNISSILSGDTTVPKTKDAEYAQNLLGTIRNIPIENIFVEGTSIVQKAKTADSADIKNLDDTPDIVHLQIGDGVQYRHVVNQVQHANEAELAHTAPDRDLTDNSTNIANTAFVTSKFEHAPTYNHGVFTAQLWVEDNDIMLYKNYIALSAYGVKYYCDGKWYWRGTINGGTSPTTTGDVWWVKQIELRKIQLSIGEVTRVVNGGVFIQKTHDAQKNATSIFYDVESTRLNDSGQYNMCRYYAEDPDNQLIFQSGVNMYILITDIILELKS